MSRYFEVDDLGAAAPYKITFMEYYIVQASHLDSLLESRALGAAVQIEHHKEYFYLFRNAKALFSNIAAHFEWSWDEPISDYLRNLLLILLGSALASLCLSVFMQVQTSRSYDYLNQVYGMMCTYSLISIVSHKLIMVELFMSIEKKVLPRDTDRRQEDQEESEEEHDAVRREQEAGPRTQDLRQVHQRYLEASGHDGAGLRLAAAHHLRLQRHASREHGAVQRQQQDRPQPRPGASAGAGLGLRALLPQTG